MRSLAATLYVSRRTMPISTSSSQAVALEQAFDGIKQALIATPAKHDDGRAYVSKAARLELAKLLGAPTQRSVADTAQAIIGRLQRVKDAQGTKNLNISNYAGAVKSTAFLFWCIRWLEKQAEEELKADLFGDTVGLEEFADEENRASQILKQNENGIFNKRSRKALLSMHVALKLAWMLPFKPRIGSPQEDRRSTHVRTRSRGQR